MEDEPSLPVSALQHMGYCKRRAALTTLEQLWADNRHTAEGTVFHEVVHGGEPENRPGLHIARGVPLCSVALGLYGVADVVEFHSAGADGCAVPGLEGRWRPLPVEYKHGKTRQEEAYRFQLCAQALCLEEMLGVRIAEGALYYAGSRQRLAVALDGDLRAAVINAAHELHSLVREGITPVPREGAWCRECSLRDLCLPQTGGKNVRAYIKRMLADSGKDTP